MTRDKTVFVIGAGASTEFGTSMPVGTQLATRIEAALNLEFSEGTRSHHGPIVSALMEHARGFGPDQRRAANQVRRALHGKDSIDDLLDDWNDQPMMAEVSKIAIAHIILEGEKYSSLGEEVTSNDELLMAASKLRGSWLGLIARYFKPDVRRRNLVDAFKTLGFIVFNYDRCIERFLYAEFQAHAGLSESDAQTAVRNIPIIHPHGQLGDLFGGVCVPFGAQSLPLWRVSQNIKTYSEEAHDQTNLARMRDLLRVTHRVVMLGFSYHPANTRLLHKVGLAEVPEIYGSCLHPDPARVRALQDLIAAGPDQVVNLLPKDCRSFLQEYDNKILT